MLCRACHGFVHQVLTEKELEHNYHSVGALLGHEEIGKFALWLSRKPAGFHPVLRR